MKQLLIAVVCVAGSARIGDALGNFGGGLIVGLVLAIVLNKRFSSRGGESVA